MAIPVLSWFQRHLTAERIDQHFARHSFRMIIGLEVAEDFSRVAAALMLMAGRGKYLRVQHSLADQQTVPEALAQDLRQWQAELAQLTTGPANSETTGSRPHSKPGTRPIVAGESLLFDLAEVQAAVVQRLKAQAGKYVERILAVSVHDPGLWHSDFDGRWFYRSACDPARLAELTGMNVIDAFPQADLYAGGQTQALGGLPLWLQFADRATPVANASTLVVQLSPYPQVWGLPGSDGADDWLPQIQWRVLVDRDSLPPQSFVGPWPAADPANATTTAPPRRGPLQHIDPLRTNLSPETLKRWSDQILAFADNFARTVEPKLPLQRFVILGPETWRQQFLGELSALASTRTKGCDFTAWQELPSEPIAAPQPLRVAPQHLAEGNSANLASGAPNSEPTTLRPTENGKIGSVGLVSALLGMLHIDQVPANLPHVTGAEGLRILGRLTPGKLSVWRHLLTNMTDTQSPIMRLKDAV